MSDARRLRLGRLTRCFQGIVPCVITTASADGIPNITYISQVHYIDDQHIALSRQFFNKTQQNLSENPYASVQVHDALTFETYQLQVRFLRSETSGPIFAAMSARIEAIATHTGMRGVFKLIGADVCEVMTLEKVEGFLQPDGNAHARVSVELERGAMSELRGLQVVSARINRASDMEQLLTSALAALDELFGLKHSMVLHPDETVSAWSRSRVAATAARAWAPRSSSAKV